MKTSIPCCPLTSKSTHFFLTVFACKWCLIFACFSSDSDETRTHILVGSKGLNIKNTLMLDLFLTNMQLLRRSLMDWSGVDYLWIFVMSYQLCGRSFWRHHSLQRIHWWASDEMLHFSKSVLMIKKLIYILDGLPWGWVHFQQIFIFWVNYAFKHLANCWWFA